MFTVLFLLALGKRLVYAACFHIHTVGDEMKTFLTGFVYPVIQMLHLDTIHLTVFSVCFYLVHQACEQLSGNLHQWTIMNTCDRFSLSLLTHRLQMNGLLLLTRMGRQGPGNQTLVVNVEAKYSEDIKTQIHVNLDVPHASKKNKTPQNTFSTKTQSTL